MHKYIHHTLAAPYAGVTLHIYIHHTLAAPYAGVTMHIYIHIHMLHLMQV